MRGSLMRLWTPEQHAAMLTKHQDNGVAAAKYTKHANAVGKVVTRQNVAYWRTIFLVNEGNMAGADRALKQGRKLRKPEPDDDIGALPDLDNVYHCILHIPDQHAPYHHPDMLEFLHAVGKAFPIDLVVNAGDEVDHHAMSFHDSDPNLDSAGTELEKAKPVMERLHAMFPQQLVCSSNHGSMAFRKAKAHGIPVQYLKSYREVLFPKHKAPGWSWAYEWIIKTPLGDVMFKHQSSNPTSEAAHERCNLMVGHNHGRFSVDYAAGSSFLYWGATGGCLIDKDAYAYAYGKHSTNKPIIGCTIIMEGRPILIPMVLDNQGRWVGVL